MSDVSDRSSAQDAGRSQPGSPGEAHQPPALSDKRARPAVAVPGCAPAGGTAPPQTPAAALTAAADPERIRVRLQEELGLALRRSRRSGEPLLASLVLELQEPLDPTAVACASRRAGEPWFCFEQPDRGGAAIGALGEALHLRAAGAGRFAQLSSDWRDALAHAHVASISTSARTDGRARGSTGERSRAAVGAPLAVGGFAFAPDGASTPVWEGFEPASLWVPELLLRRAGGQLSATLSVLVAPDDACEDLVARLERRLDELSAREPPLVDPAPSERHRVVSAMPPQHYEAAVARARELIADGDVAKVVLAREVQVHAPDVHDPAAVFGALREAFPSCFVLCAGRGEAALVAASPELLVRREGLRLSTMALAGSSRRSADPAVDEHLGEQLLRSPSYREEHDIVVRRIERNLRAHAVWVASAPEPALVRVANIQHLGTPIRAQLAEPRDVIQLAALLHPTPAVGGEPSERALSLIPALEGLDRGWYAGPVGWIDAAGDGELCVALRCALLRGRVAHCYAGNGIVRDSDPAAELAETEVKLQALLPLLAG